MTTLDLRAQKRDLAPFWQVTRPFTLIAPAIGIVSAALIAFGATRRPFDTHYFWLLLAGALLAVCLNAASNILNQIFDLSIDIINKPERPLPAGTLSIRDAWGEALLFYLLAHLLAGLIGGWTLLIVSLAAALTVIYSVPPFRTKRWWLPANLTIAAARGTLLTVAGWSMVAPVDVWEPWFLGLIIGVFIFGAATTKDYADIEGDRANGCRTLPILVGVRRSAFLSAPFFVLPFILLALGVPAGWVCANPLELYGLSGAMSLWGLGTIALVLRDPLTLDRGNHPSWRSMYLMMMALYVGLVMAYS